MGLTKNDRDKIVSHAKSEGYSWNSKGSKMTDGHGGSASFSAAGGSVKVNGNSYSSVSAAKKSSRW